MDKKKNLRGLSLLILSILFLASISYVGYVPSQGEFIKIIVPYTVAFFLYALLIFRVDMQNYFTSLLLLAIAVRVILVFSFPNLSDDIYRFLWDANLILEGKNPYMHLPSNIVVGDTQQLFDKLNSQDYYSPYPPLSQLVYTTSAMISTGNEYWFSVLIKAMTFLAEIGSIYYILKILKQLQLDRTRVFIYALNPLILIELLGNLHFESFMIFFMLMTVYFMINQNVIKSSLTFILAIISKLLPMMFGPFILAYWGIKRGFKFSIYTGLGLLIVLIPVLYSMIDGVFFSSVGLYFQKFEFNASLYYVLREVGFITHGYNIIGMLGPGLALITVSAILWIWFKYRSSIDAHNLFLFLLFTISLYLFCATTIHPWYVALPLVFCLFTDFRYPVLWSGLIMLTYVNYSFVEYREVMLIVFIEYVFVFGFLIYEFNNHRHKKALMN